MTPDIAGMLRESYGREIARSRPLPGETDINHYVETAAGEHLLVKITRDDPNLVAMQSRALRHLQQKGSLLRLPLPIPNLAGADLTAIAAEDGAPAHLRVLQWVSGRLWVNVRPHSRELLLSLGRAAGSLSRDLADFEDAMARRVLKWDPVRVSWTRGHFEVFETLARRQMAEDFLRMFETLAAPRLRTCRQSVNHNDLNDYNIVVGGRLDQPEVQGIVDFGDTAVTLTVDELAIACAYAMMDHPDPITAACAVIEGYHQVFPLAEDEIALLFPLIGARLLISVTCSAINRKEQPGNAYLQVSDRPAWDLMRRLATVPPPLAHYAFRAATGRAPCPQAALFQDWLAKNQPRLGPVVRADLAKARFLDLGIGSCELGHNQAFEDAAAFERFLARVQSEEAQPTLLGHYHEVRPIYVSDAFRYEGNDGPLWRAVHLGVDVFMPAGTPVFAPFPGRVHYVGQHPDDRDWGGLLILEHRISRELVFYTLYGHLDPASLTLEVGARVRKGRLLAQLGKRPENGNWPPHLHLQVLLDTLGKGGEFPGVAPATEREVWLSLCPDPAALLGLPSTTPAAPDLSTDQIFARRRQHLGPNLSVAYRRPLQIVRGYMQYLYDETGRRYLDGVNNVAHVGHQHPRVVRTAQQQIAVLNTNTRYLHAEIVRFAEELCATLPPELRICYFVNSGSEANELALRLAEAHTGRKDMVVVEAGYHGNSTGCVSISSYKFDGAGGGGAPDHVHVVPIPYLYRGRHREDDPRAGEHYAEYVETAVREADARGRPVAGFICESVLSCGGQIVLPRGYLSNAYQHVRRAGGVCIADEVQVGFGRVGEAFWGFELQGVVPDIVTLGKPIGNGHPLGAVVTTPRIAEAFATGMEYFSTFGGNPVSCAVGREVLRIVREDRLQEHAQRVGQHLLSGLRDLQRDFPVIGDVRGVGLFLGVELVRDREKREPAPEPAAYLANRMRELGVLVSTDGREQNVIKIKPPLAFQAADADFLLDTLRRVLREDAMSIGSPAV